MSTLIDIVFCVGYTSSITSDFNEIRAIITFIFNWLLDMQVNARIGRIKFRSMADTWNTIVHGFTQDINVLQQWLAAHQPDGISPDGYESVGDALNEALNLGWRNDDQTFHEKVVILFTDGAPNGLFTPLDGADPWVISNKFRQQGITLIVVGVGGSIVVCDDFYCALAKNTGGEYIPMVNFRRIFLQVLNSVFNESDTVYQALTRVSIEEIEQNSLFKYKYMEHRVTGMINECESMSDIKEKFYKYK